MILKGFKYLFSGKFFTAYNFSKNTVYGLFVAFLLLFMIYRSHSADAKVREIKVLDNRVKQLRSEYVELRSQVMELKTESVITKRLADRGFAVGVEPPKKIKVINDKN